MHILRWAFFGRRTLRGSHRGGAFSKEMVFHHKIDHVLSSWELAHIKSVLTKIRSHSFIRIYFIIFNHIKKKIEILCKAGEQGRLHWKIKTSKKIFSWLLLFFFYLKNCLFLRGETLIFSFWLITGHYFHEFWWFTNSADIWC